MIRLIGMGLLAFLLLTLEQWSYKKLWKKGLKISIQFQKDAVFEGEKCSLTEVVENRKKLPLSMLKVKFQTGRDLLFEDTGTSQITDKYYRNDVFRIGGNEKVTRILTFTGSRRGVYGIHEVDLVAADLFLTSQMVETLSVNASLYVFPKPFDSREFRLSLRQLNGEVITKRHLLEDPFEYRGIREYQPFDDIRSINWKATAKTGEFKVNQRNYTALQSVRIFLNLEDNGILKKTEAVENAIRIAAGLCEFFLEEGIQVSCYSNSMDVLSGGQLSIEAGAGRGQMMSIYRGLSRIDISKVSSFTKVFRDKIFTEAEGTITCFVSPNQYEDFVHLMEEYQDAGGDYIWFYPVESTAGITLPGTLSEHIRVIPLSNIELDAC